MKYCVTVIRIIIKNNIISILKWQTHYGTENLRKCVQLSQYKQILMAQLKWFLFDYFVSKACEVRRTIGFYELREKHLNLIDHFCFLGNTIDRFLHPLEFHTQSQSPQLMFLHTVLHLQLMYTDTASNCANLQKSRNKPKCKFTSVKKAEWPVCEWAWWIQAFEMRSNSW